MDIYPSILETDIDHFKSTLEKLLPVFNHFQIDITDGIFVPGKTVQIEDISSTIQGLSFDFHLMVKDYEKELAKLDKLKPLSVLIHLKSLNKIFNFQLSTFKLGIVLNPEDQIGPNLATIMLFPIVQIMTVHPGQQGSPFLPKELEKINQLRDNGFKGKIILDGGINDQTLPIILKNQFLPDAVAPGSYFAKAENPAQNLAKLSSILAHNKYS